MAFSVLSMFFWSKLFRVDNVERLFKNLLPVRSMCLNGTVFITKDCSEREQVHRYYSPHSSSPFCFNLSYFIPWSLFLGYPITTLHMSRLQKSPSMVRLPACVVPFLYPHIMSRSTPKIDGIENKFLLLFLVASVGVVYSSVHSTPRKNYGPCRWRRARNYIAD